MHDLILIIAPKHWDEDIIDKALKAGAKGGTILHGRSIASDECHNLLGLVVEPEKEIVLMVVKTEQTDDILNALKEELDLGKPHHGIALVFDAFEPVGLRG